MTKRSFVDAFDDLTADVVSTMVKHAKTLDFEPFIELLRTTVPIVSVLMGADREQVEEEIDKIDENVIHRTLTAIGEKMLTTNKDGSFADNTSPSPQGASAETGPAASETDDNGQETAAGGDGHAPATGKFTGADGDENAGKENDGSPGRDSVECHRSDSDKHGQADQQ